MKPGQAKLSRRNFLFAAAAGTAATAAAVGINATQSSKPKKQADASGQGYQLTEHVRNYYRTAKI